MSALFFPRFTVVRNAWWPGYLYGAGQQGAFLRPSPEYLFTDSARTTPITAPGQPFGGATDLSGNGNHWAQPSDPDRPVFGVVPETGRTNRLLHTESIIGNWFAAGGGGARSYDNGWH